ncbi:hypothetical protein NP493_1504g00050 [Ridgeia piscesae]|uniref:Uncharacterized protein n=1 Tax=Ridgeia piscesae TaxID=27915 RepID=A0AAD9K258_RIDPI|nr:hypothetical protein NP493_1504g00050 [Ridgeia piscesae]
MPEHTATSGASTQAQLISGKDAPNVTTTTNVLEHTSTQDGELANVTQMMPTESVNSDFRSDERIRDRCCGHNVKTRD